MNKLDLILYVLLLMTSWDLFIHVLDWKKLGHKFINSSSPFSYIYPHFWGKHPQVSEQIGRTRYDYFWMAYWGIATILLLTYIIVK